MPISLRNVHAIRKKVRGKWRTYYYHRHTRQRLPDDPRSPEFLQALAAQEKPAQRYVEGTVGEMIAGFLESPTFAKLRPASKAHYRWALDYLREMAEIPLLKMDKAKVLRLRDKLNDRPGRFNTFTSVMKLVFGWASSRGMLPYNPVADIKRAKMGEYKAWPQDAVQAFLKHRTCTPMMRLAMFLAIYTGQRQSDCLAMRWSQYDGTAITLKQVKTGVDLWIPVHSALKAELDAAKGQSKSVFILHHHTGKPWTRHGFSGAWRYVTREAGLLGYPFHGLRKTAAQNLAEAGCTDREIQAITGHESAAMVAHYRKRADQRISGKAAIEKLEIVNQTGKFTENGS